MNFLIFKKIIINSVNYKNNLFKKKNKLSIKIKAILKLINFIYLII